MRERCRPRELIQDKGEKSELGMGRGEDDHAV